MNKLYCLIIMFIICRICDAQIDLQCNGRDMHSIYISAYPGYLYRMDSVDTNPTNPIFLTGAFSGGISINANLDSLAGSETMYSVSFSGYYYFWNGTNWTNTNHTIGAAAAVNPGGTSSYIFNLDGIGTSLYRYDGTGNGTLLLSNLGSPGSIMYDVATDNQGNFYLCYCNTLQKIIAYNSAGINIDSFSTTGLTSCGGGFAILGNRMYVTANNSYDLYEGIKTGSNINFTLIKTFPFMAVDLATCLEASNPLSVSDDNSSMHTMIYPNPFFDKLSVLLDDNKNSEINLYDITSRKMLQEKFTSSVALNTEQLAKGIYLYEVRNKNGVIKKGKVVKPACR